MSKNLYTTNNKVTLISKTDTTSKTGDVRRSHKRRQIKTNALEIFKGMDGVI